METLFQTRWMKKLFSRSRHRNQTRVETPRRWRLVQVESSIACNLKCIMCPWRELAHQHYRKGHMESDVWGAIASHLTDIQSIDFTGGGEPLLQPHLIEWVREAGEAGCETGLLTNGTLLTAKKGKQLIEAGIDWICISMDGATADVYEQIRPGARFQKVCDNASLLTAQRIGRRPKVMINFVMMQSNVHQLGAMVELAGRLGVDQINFKQCDVIRGDSGKGFGLFADKTTREIRKLEKKLWKARRLAKKKGIETTAYAWVPEELPVCVQDPRNSMFIRHDGSVAQCINLALGGAKTFLGNEVMMPNVLYGRLPEEDLLKLWQTTMCRSYRERFEERMLTYETAFLRSDLEPSATKLKQALENAQKAMPLAPEGCQVCHYLYNI